MLLKNNIPIRYVFGKIKAEVALVTAYAILVAVMYLNFHFTRISIPIAVPTMLGTILSLLLAFRSNQAYDRWWEARTLWGAIVNDSRSLTRQILNFVDTPYTSVEALYFKERFVKRQIAWCYSLGQSLRKLPPLQEADKFMTKEQLAFLQEYTNKPVGLLELHGEDLRFAYKEGWINKYQQVEIDRTLTRLCNAMGGCERIKNTVFPATYSLYTHLALVLFILMLPFGVIDVFGVMMVPLVVAIASSFLLIEKMAIHLQDPFENKPTDTPMSSIAQTIDRDLRQMLREYKEPEVVAKPPQKVTFFVL
ncbi:bestrophin family protein [Rufibacter psychrotolerans]|uniref:bestrophin family protein n=1 Tax=Rufibacter psychrotolerans TaxID=2812556 RepID=UPI0019682E38|nr:bestrophin family ion channel [Rufibacter sp. SYSU D00308]